MIGKHVDFLNQENFDIMAIKFGIGDKVRVVNYGSLIWSKRDLSDDFPIIKKTEDVTWYDMSPDLVGQVGIISSAPEKTTSKDATGAYSIEGIQGKTAWYYEDQLELVEANPNNQ